MQGGGRRLLYRAHAWCGLVLGLYVVMLSVTGSAIVFKPELTAWAITDTVPSTEGNRLAGDALAARIADTYPDHEVLSVSQPPVPEAALRVALTREGVRQQRYFDPYRGEDLGSTFPFTARALQWLGNLHADLLVGREGRRFNVVGGVLFLGMACTGLALWWRGRARWHQGLMVRRRSRRGIAWELHGFLGLWTSVLFLAWGITAVYFAFPLPFELFVERLGDDPTGRERSEGVLLLLIDLHFGRFAGFWSGVAWVALGLVPALMFVTGVAAWWRRSAVTRR